MTQKTIELIRRSDGEFVTANFYTCMKSEDILLVEREWGPFRSQIMQELLDAPIERSHWPQNLHWDWTRKAPQVKQSIDEGFGGRVGLHALPQANKFYSETLPMKDFGPDANKQNLNYFEISEKLANQFSAGATSDE